jgi:hypothetical protein
MEYGEREKASGYSGRGAPDRMRRGSIVVASASVAPGRTSV